MDAFCRCVEGQEPLMSLGVAPQRHRPLQKPSSCRLAIFFNHLLDPRALFCRMDRLDGFHAISVPRTDDAELSPIAQAGSVLRPIVETFAPQ